MVQTLFCIHYEQFQVASANDKYKLTVGGFQGTKNDHDPVTKNNNGMYFTTKDRDNDIHGGTNCALWSTQTGGWWY